ncbi:hypothetical protein BDW02DRAFT_365401 [Decorospora gaudefroyi]|uniref:Uncharacterized protein n=1 Tax=Decorospora gaudefroyi TaxID=184978 RepID=A0A6A5KVN0_9PLEO|nr:hypothetical protein BDW02DRAFT_365401 [Decorospora gaudefroyi]
MMRSLSRDAPFSLLLCWSVTVGSVNFCLSWIPIHVPRTILIQATQSTLIALNRTEASYTVCKFETAFILHQCCAAHPHTSLISLRDRSFNALPILQTAPKRAPYTANSSDIFVTLNRGSGPVAFDSPAEPIQQPWQLGDSGSSARQPSTVSCHSCPLSNNEAM